MQFFPLDRIGFLFIIYLVLQFGVLWIILQRIWRHQWSCSEKMRQWYSNRDNWPCWVTSKAPYRIVGICFGFLSSFFCGGNVSVFSFLGASLKSIIEITIVSWKVVQFCWGKGIWIAEIRNTNRWRKKNKWSWWATRITPDVIIRAQIARIIYARCSGFTHSYAWRELLHVREFNSIVYKLFASWYVVQLAWHLWCRYNQLMERPKINGFFSQEYRYWWPWWTKRFFPVIAISYQFRVNSSLCPCQNEICLISYLIVVARSWLVVQVSWHILGFVAQLFGIWSGEVWLIGMKIRAPSLTVGTCSGILTNRCNADIWSFVSLFCNWSSLIVFILGLVVFFILLLSRWYWSRKIRKNNNS